jgi:hypothetical protein
MVQDQAIGLAINATSGQVSGSPSIFQPMRD